MKYYLRFPDDKTTRILKDFVHACKLWHKKYRYLYDYCLIYTIYGDFVTTVVEGSV